jgi:Tfp pilus assembly protein PilN
MSAPNQLSFLPDDYLELKAQRRTNVICAILFLIVMLAIGSAFAITERSLRKVEAEHAAVEKQYAEAARRIKQVQELQQKQRTMAQQAELAASLLERVPRSFLLAELTNSLPVNTALLDLKMESKLRPRPAAVVDPTKSAADLRREARARKASGADTKAEKPPAVAKEYDVTLRLTGVAPTDVQVASFIAKLNQSKLVRDVNLIISDAWNSEGQQLRKFQIDMQVNPLAQVLPAGTGTPASAAVEVTEPK